MGAGFDFLEHEGTGFDAGRLAAVIPVGVVNVEGGAGVGFFDEADPGADAGMAVSPGAAGDFFGRVGEPKGAVLLWVDFPGAAIIKEG